MHALDEIGAKLNAAAEKHFTVKSIAKPTEKHRLRIELMSVTHRVQFAVR